LSDPEAPRYVRFGYLPRTGRSRHRGVWKAEKGVSCFPGRLVDPGCFRIDTSGISNEDLGTLFLWCAADRPAVFLSGEEVGVGSDGEPLLKVERFWPVPPDVDLTSYDGLTQPALRLWSRGPRDDSGRRRLRQRLAPGAGYVPSSLTVDARAFERLHGVQPTKKPGEKRAGHKRKQQTQARKKQRRKK
jgi:hypothetical protein